MCGWHVCPHFENMQVHFPPAGSGALVLCIYNAPGYLVFYSKDGQECSTLLYMSLLLATWWFSTSLMLATVGAILYPRSPSPRGIHFGLFFGGDTLSYQW